MTVRREKRRRTIEADLTKIVLTPIRLFWRDHDEQHLKDATAAVERVVTAGPEPSITAEDHPAVVSLRIRGWLAPQRRFRVSVSALKRANPGYRVTLRRSTRKDVESPTYLRFWRSGFEVHAEGNADLPPFIFGVADLRRRLRPLRPTNEDARFAVNFLGSIQSDEKALLSHSPQGAIDDIYFWQILDPADRRTWIQSLAGAYPEELLELAEYQERSPLAVYLATLLVGSPANARWAARFALSAGIDFDVPPTGLLALTVWRPDQPTAPGPVLLPVLERDGSVVTARQGTETIPMPSSRWLNLESARIQCGGIVTVDNKLVLYEEAADPSHDFVANYEGILFGSRANPSQALLAPFPPAAESIDEGILLAGRNDTNWYHWLIEYLPRVLEIPQDIGQAVPLLVSAGTPASGLDALRSLSDREVVLIDPGLSQEVSRLHVLAPPVQIVDSTRVSWDSGLLVNPGPLCKARQVWRQDAAAPSRLIFLRRRSRHRGMGNQLALERIAVSMGLEVVDPSDLTWDEQREIFTTAKLVVGASGAVMANYLLMPSGGRVLALTSELLDGFILPAVIAGICGVDFTYLLGPATDSLEKFTHRREWFHGDFTVDADAFRAVLGSELQRVPLHQNPS